MTAEKLELQAGRIRTKTAAELDALCGSTPTEYASCPVCSPERKFGPYYSGAEARDAMRSHVSSQHPA